MNKNRNEKGQFIKGHKINLGRSNALGTHHRNPESFRRMRSEKIYLLTIIYYQFN